MKSVGKILKTKVNFLIRITTNQILRLLAEQDHRHPGQMIDWLVEQEARRRGILSPAPAQENIE